MTEFVLRREAIHLGHYRGTLSARGRVSGDPVLELRLLGDRVGAVSVEATAGADRKWTVDAPIPADLIGDGIQTFVIHDTRSGETLDSFAILAGTPLAGDLGAEIDLLRGELEALKAAFRRHATARRRK